MFETIGGVSLMTLVGGLKFPKIAIACMLAYCVGSYGYMSGCASGPRRDVHTRRTHS